MERFRLLLMFAAATAWCMTGLNAHVALTFPPARQPAFDFLDNGRTPPPCGVPKGTLKTSILTGSTFNVTWHLGYPHRGGFRIQVLNEREKPVLELSSFSDTSTTFVKGDATALAHEVHIPKDFVCRNCTIRLLRQASEWGPNYMFWSCADVDIIPRPEYRETCSGHGKDIAGRCRCSPLYSGHKCQYRDECYEDKDCGRHGKCFHLEGATSFPKRQCFCEMGWFGPQCTQASPVKDPSIINLADYRRESMSDNFDFYWRVLRNSQELEAVMVVKGGTSYAAVGWRPASLTSACKSFPVLHDLVGSFASTNEPEPDDTLLESASPEPEPEPESVAPLDELETSAQPEPSAEPEPVSSSTEHQHDHQHVEQDGISTSTTTTESASTLSSSTTTEASTTTTTTTKAPIESLLESPTENRAIVSATSNSSPPPPAPIKTLISRPKLATPIGRPALATTARTTTTTSTEASVATDQEAEGEEEESVEPLSSSTATPISTTTKKLSPLDRLIAKNKLAAANNNNRSVGGGSTVSPEAPKSVTSARGSVTRIQLSDLPESGVTTGTSAAGRRRAAALATRNRRETVELEPLDDPAEEIVSSLESERHARQNSPLGVPINLSLFPGPRGGLGSSSSVSNRPLSSLALSVQPTTRLVPPPAAVGRPVLPAAELSTSITPPAVGAAAVAKPGFSPVSGSDGWIPMSPQEIPGGPLALEPIVPDSIDRSAVEEEIVIRPVETTPSSATAATTRKKAVTVPSTSTTSTTTTTTEETPAPHNHDTIAESAAHDETAQAEPEADEPKAEPEPEPASASPEPEPEPTSSTSSSTTGNGQVGGDEATITSPEPTNVNVALKYVPKADFHPMDCADMVIGMMRGNYSRIGDYYTRDRSTPQLDNFYGGRQDLTAALGYERDGQTVILFRRRLNVTDEADHVIGSEPMQVIWARGQEHGAYVHSPPSGLEKENSSVSQFYQPDELKYHGTNKQQRGVTVITFIEPAVKAVDSANATSQDHDDHHQHSGHDHGTETIGRANDQAHKHKHKTGAFCGGEWKYPVTCDPSLSADCTYYAKWEYLEQPADQIRFTITTKFQSNRWLAIGFSETTSMPQTDVVLGWVEPNGRVFVGDMWASGYQSPKLDDSQDLLNTSGRIEEGQMTLSFTRQRITKDKQQDAQFTDENCLYMKFPVQGGTYNAVSKKISKHLQTPFISSDRVCIRSCGGGDTGGGAISYTTTPAPPKIYYNIGLKMVGLANDFQAPEMGSPEFNELADRFSRQVESVLTQTKTGQRQQPVPGFEEVVVTEFSEENGGLVAHMSVVLDKKKAEEFERSSELKVETESLVRSALQGAIASGQMGTIRVDPSYLQFESVLDASTGDPLEVSGRGWNSSLTTISLYCVIGCIIVLVIIAIFQASCTIYKVSRKLPNSNKDQTAVNWRDYSSTNYGYEPFETDEALRAAAVLAANNSNGHTTVLTSSVASATPIHNNRQRTPAPLVTGGGSIGSSTKDRNSATYSLPRTNATLVNGSGSHSSGRPRTQSSTSIHQQQHQPDFYFMPSQRRYSGYPDYHQ